MERERKGVRVGRRRCFHVRMDVRELLNQLLVLNDPMPFHFSFEVFGMIRYPSVCQYIMER